MSNGTAFVRSFAVHASSLFGGQYIGHWGVDVVVVFRFNCFDEARLELSLMVELLLWAFVPFFLNSYFISSAVMPDEPQRPMVDPQWLDNATLSSLYT